MKTFGEQLSEARKAAGMTQERLAEEMGFTRQGISNWERDRSLPDPEIILRLSELLHFRFTLPAEPSQPVPKPVPAARPAPMVRRRTAIALCVGGFIAGLLMMFLLMQLVLPVLVSGKGGEPGAVPEDILPNTVEWFSYDRSYDVDHACVKISFNANPVKAAADSLYEGGYGWSYTYYMTEMNGYDFYPETFSEYFFDGNGEPGSPFTYTADDLTIWWGESKIAAEDQRIVRGGIPLQDVMGIGLKITGRDAAGEALEFYGYLELSQEIEEGQAG